MNKSTSLANEPPEADYSKKNPLYKPNKKKKVTYVCKNMHQSRRIFTPSFPSALILFCSRRRRDAEEILQNDDDTVYLPFLVCNIYLFVFQFASVLSQLSNSTTCFTFDAFSRQRRTLTANFANRFTLWMWVERFWKGL